MRTDPDKQLATSRRRFARSLIPAIGVALAAPLKAEAQRKNRRQTRDKETDQTSPITIGGGGGTGLTENLSYISIHFDRAWYKKHPVYPNRYWRWNDRLHKLWVTDHYGKKKHLPTKPFSIIKVHCVRASDNHDSPIELRARPFSVEFIPTDYPYDPTKEVFYCLGRKITTIEIDGKLVFTATEGTCNIDADNP